MSLAPRDRQALTDIEGGLRRSGPWLAAKFTRRHKTIGRADLPAVAAPEVTGPAADADGEAPVGRIRPPWAGFYVWW
jgi:hypothetical protein